MQSTALFTNFSAEVFEGFWDGKGRKFQPGQTMYMPAYLAEHFAKHLVNRELVRKDKNGNLIYPHGETQTSPKEQSDVPQFMELFNQAYKEEEDDIGDKNDNVDSLIASANKNRVEGDTVSKDITPPLAKTPAQKAAETRARNKALADAKEPQPPSFEK